MSYPGTIRPPFLQVSAFGDHPVVQFQTEVDAYPDRFDDPRVWTQLLESGASISAASSELPTVSLGTTNGALARCRTRGNTRYVPGFGSVFRFAGAFLTGGVADCKQYYGPGHEEDGLWVGYNGVDFGVFHRYGARREIETLTLSAGASGAENATITLAGTAHVVPLTAGTAAFNAAEIADWGAANGFADADDPYVAYALGSTVLFVRSESGVPPAGAFSFSSTGTAAGTFAQTQAGAVGTETFAALGQTTGRIEAIDALDGSGPSKLTLDPTKGNVYAVTLGWLGVAGATWWILDVPNSRFWPISILDWANHETDSCLTDPRLPLGLEIESFGSVTNVQFRLGSQKGAIQGDLPRGLAWGRSVETAAGAIVPGGVPIIAIRNAPTLSDRINRRRVKVTALTVTNIGSKAGSFKVYSIPDVTEAEWIQTDPQSAVQQATSFGTFSGGNEIGAIGVAPGETQRIPIAVSDLDRGEVFLVTGSVSAASTEAIVAFTGEEDQ